MMPSPSLTTENTEFTEEGTEKNNSVDAHIIGQIQLEAAIEHYNHKLDAGYRADFIVENSIILEIKSVEKLVQNHDAQILNYMRLGKFKLGLLMNFNETLLKNGLKRFKI